MKNNRNRTIIVIIGIILFFTGLFVYHLYRSGFLNRNSQEGSGVVNTTITFDQPKLKVFDDLLFLNEFPDTIRIHDPYFLIVAPENYKQITTVYDVRTKTTVATLNDPALDYFNGNFLYNKNGVTTYYNKQSLGLHCQVGFIQSPTSILCITAKAKDPIDNKLISINPQTLVKQDISSSQEHLGALNVINGTIYIGGVNLATGMAFLNVNGNNVYFPMPTPVDLIYPMQGHVYFATFKRSGQNQEGKYYLLEQTEGVFHSQQQGSGKIVLFQ